MEDEHTNNKIGPKKNKSELEIYLNTPVRVSILSNSSAIGIVEKISSEYLYLKNSLINQGLYDQDKKFIDKYKIEDKLPQMIKLMNIIGIEPLDEGYMEKLATNINSYQIKKD